MKLSENTRDTIITGIGFAADAYDLFIIGIVLVILKDLYKESVVDISIVATVSLASAILGQLVFGYLALKFGRVKPFVATLIMIIIGSIGSSLAFDSEHVSIFYCLSIWRFVMGFGIGGEYPLSATIAKEKSINSNRPTVLVFSMQGIGYLFSAIMFIATVKWVPMEWLWRLLLFVGCVPGLLTIYSRTKMQETSDYNSLTEHKITLTDFKVHWRTLLGTAGSWFLFDITFYGNGIFASTLLNNLIQGTMKTWDTAIFNIIIAVIGLSGYYCSWFTIDKFNKRSQQIVGFLSMAIIFSLIGILYPYIKDNMYAFTTLYGLTFFLSNWGPNTTTYVIPTIVYEARVRPTFHGISAAAGKLGAVIGAAMMTPISNVGGIPLVMYVSCGISLLGAVWSLWLPKQDIPRGIEYIPL